MKRRLIGLGLTVVLAGGCSDANPGSVGGATASGEVAMAGTPEGIPAHAPDRFGFGYGCRHDGSIRQSGRAVRDADLSSAAASARWRRDRVDAIRPASARPPAAGRAGGAAARSAIAAAGVRGPRIDGAIVHRAEVQRQHLMQQSKCTWAGEGGGVAQPRVYVPPPHPKVQTFEQFEVWQINLKFCRGPPL